MDVIIQLFQRHISPETLQEHRLACANITNMIVVSLSEDLLAASMSFLDKENTELKNVESAISQSFLSANTTNQSKIITILHETNLPTITSSASSQDLAKSNHSPTSSKSSSAFENFTMLQETKLPTVASASINVSTQILDESYLSDKVKSIPSGSNVEGANLARLFFEGTQGEVEVDVMFQVLQINKAECLEQCDKSNPMFVHIMFKMDLDVLDERVRGCSGDLQKFLTCKSYISSDFLKSEAKFFVNKSPDFLKKIGGHKPNVDLSTWKSKDAAGTFNIVFSNDCEYNGERESNPQDLEKNVINEVQNVSPEFKLQANDMVQKLKQIQDNFLAARLEGKSKVVQISIAVEWSKQCLLLTNTLFDHRQKTIGNALRQLIGLETKEMTENIRIPLKEKFENHLSTFNTLFHDPDSVKAEQTLLDFETDLKSLRCLIGLDAFLQQELLFMETVHIAQKETEDLKHNPDNLLNTSENVSRLSIDLVFCLKCNFWPEVAAEWPKREREWPEQATIKNIVTDGIHVVCKELHHSAIDWRLSFSVAEIKITQQWTPWQHYIYFIFKSLFYKYLKPLSNKDIKVITSYLFKTVMLNVSENFAQSWWCKENAGECLNVLLMTILSAFESKFLPHHFVPTFNLLERADKETERILNTAIDILNSLLLKPEEVVSNLSATLKVIEKFIQVSKAQTAMKNQIDTKLLPLIRLSANPFSNYDFNKWK